MSINHITGGGGGLGSESAGTMRYSSGSFVDFSRLPITETPRTANTVGLLQQLLSSHLTRHLFPEHLPPPPKTTVAYIWLRRGLFAGACVREGGTCRVPALAPHPTHTAFSGRGRRNVVYSIYRPTFRGHPASSAAAYPLPSANRVEPCLPLSILCKNVLLLRS